MVRLVTSRTAGRDIRSVDRQLLSIHRYIHAALRESFNISNVTPLWIRKLSPFFFLMGDFFSPGRGWNAIEQRAARSHAADGEVIPNHSIESDFRLLAVMEGSC